jgi:hypothetical protein
MLNFIKNIGFYTVVCALALTGTCLAAGEAGEKMAEPDFSLNPDNAVVYVYREKMLKASAAAYTTYLNDEFIAQLENGEYVRYIATPGDYDLWVTNEPLRALGARFTANVREINLSRGKIYFLKIIPVFGFYWHQEIQPIDEVTAKNKILKLYETTK